MVNLDSLPLNHPVSVSYLQRSPQQADARKAAKDLGDPISLPRQVTTDGAYSFYLTGRTRAYDCRWIATITWWDGEQQRTERVDDKGEPFRVTSAGSHTEDYADFGKRGTDGTDGAGGAGG